MQTSSFRAYVLGLISLCGASSEAETIEIRFEATAQTVVGTPFGGTVPRLTTATGSFFYQTSTPDTNPSPDRGNYPHSGGGGFTACFIDKEIKGSATPFVQIENLDPDTFRFIDGPRLVGSQGGIMRVNGVADATIELGIAITDSSGNAFSDDALPDSFPFYHQGPFPWPHTFSLRDSGGTILFQFTRTLPVSLPVIDRIARDGENPLVTLFWHGTLGTSHRVESSTDLESWIPLGDEMAAGAGQNIFEDRLDLRYPDMLPVELFYRIRAF